MTTTENCTYCGGSGVTQTDIWSETSEMSQPCVNCCREERRDFWNSSPKERQEWWEE